MTDEKDPNGLDPHTPGAKLDEGKVTASLMIEDFANALLSIAEVTTHGARKYTPHGWMKVPYGRERYLDALQRHLLAYYRGEEKDLDSGLDHLSHAAWNLLAVLELHIKDKENVYATREGV